MKFALPFLLLLFLAVPVQASAPAGWTRTALPVQMSYDATNALLSTETVQAAVSEWNGSSAFSYAALTPVAGLTSLCFGQTDGISTISWAPLNDPLLIANSCYYAGECDIVLDYTMLAATDPDIVRAIIVHEAGHCAGLAHSQTTDSVMWAQVSGGSHHVTADDRHGICILYSCPTTGHAVVPNVGKP